MFIHCHQEAHSLLLAGICCADTLGTDVLHCLCQEEAQDAIDPIGIAVNKFGVLAYTCRIWEEAFSLTQKGIGGRGNSVLHVRVLIHTDLFPAKHTWRLL